MNLKLEHKNAFLFQGVGVNYKEYLSLLNESQLNDLERYSKRAKSELNIDLWEYVNNEFNNQNSEEFLEWILIYTCDCILYKSYIYNGIKSEIMIGYSMGLITAMVCAESLTFESGLRLLDCIYRYPKESNRKEEAMATIIGLDYKSISNIIDDIDLEEFVEIASENSEYCIVLAGIKNAVSKVMEIAEDQGAIRTIKLNVSYAFHSRFGAIGIEMLESLIKNIKIAKAKVPIISIFTQEVMESEEALREELVANMYTSMKWKNTILKLSDMGFEKFVDVTLNKDLTKMSKVINLENKFITYEDIISNRD